MSVPPPRSKLPHTGTRPRAEPRSFASLALASGTGEDVAALEHRGPRPRFRLDGPALRAVIIACLALIGAVWASLAFATPHQLTDEHSVAAAESIQMSGEADEGTGGAAEMTPAETDGTTEIVVYVSGHVKEPGVYTLASSSRVNDAVDAAGGLTKEADSASINLASPLEDGLHVHVPAPGEQPDSGGGLGGAGETDSAGSGLININSAGVEELQQLPGIGPKLAQAVVEWRDANGSFSSVDDLLDVSGIGNGKLEQLRDFATI
ncbi:MAG: helix-hairpin-helix domain-containing protein [Ancrocorticia sp.]|uniref:helix-hairpin-helix domain-containing protein n=2 Tax=Ancrocorticia sp. TaxID=2593684 RepID=UPI003F90DD65